jgi:REase_DpnII-MboI/Queuosine biosynthesis protein QueC
VRRGRTFLCGGVNATTDPDDVVVELNTNGADRNVNVRLEDVARVMDKTMSPRILDFLELGAYIYAADSTVKRDAAWLDQGSREPWTREFTFHVAVRDPGFWSDSATISLLRRILNFLSDDVYKIHFHALRYAPPVQLYLEFGDLEDWPFRGADRVLMFSGGLDSLAGAVETATSGAPIVLVSHRPVAALSKRQADLFAEFRKTISGNTIAIPVWVNKDASLGREFSLRTRSFLFTALGTAIAEAIQANGVRYFENGVVSLNLPVADEVLRSRASRTTHPLVLHWFQELCTRVVGRDLIVDNPYMDLTKTEVVQRLADHDASNLILHTVSCAHVVHGSSSQRHCGTCSQCIDRRIAVMAAGQSESDPSDDYQSDVFTGPRKPGYEQNMATNFVRHAIELSSMSEDEMAAKFNLQIGQAVRYEQRKSAAARKMIRTYKRHAASVRSVLEQQIAAHAPDLVERTLCETSMLALVAGQKHKESIWRRYSERIIEMLAAGLPTACKSHPPQNELHLQELCDGILRGQATVLVREFPFLRWSSTLTKPDWSAEELSLWVELKYVRQGSDVRKITEDIAADITKYGDNRRHILFVIYDPKHIVVDEPGFAADVHAHEGMVVRFIR